MNLYVKLHFKIVLSQRGTNVVPTWYQRGINVVSTWYQRGNHVIPGPITIYKTI